MRGFEVVMPLTLWVNGTEHQVDVAPDQKLLYVLRDQVGLTGTKYGCGEGQCGACTVLIDGTATRSCLTPVRLAVGKKITTIEGLEHDGQLHPVQEAFLKAEAFQCGYCTSGAIISAVALLNKNSHPSDQQIKASLEGNICRCGTYPRILDAVRAAASERRG
jgi:aerobic-type carbon monoxide dehydrogenase small subunit (CoxS/CutS family)